MTCPKCNNAEMWDNRADNKLRMSQGLKPRPDFSCKDKQNCGHVIWPPKPGEAAKRTATVGTGVQEVREPIQTGGDRSMEIARQAAGNALSRLYAGSQIDLTEFQAKIIPLAQFYKTGVIQTAPVVPVATDESLPEEDYEGMPF